MAETMKLFATRAVHVRLWAEEDRDAVVDALLVADSLNCSGRPLVAEGCKSVAVMVLASETTKWRAGIDSDFDSDTRWARICQKLKSFLESGSHFH